MCVASIREGDHLSVSMPMRRSRLPSLSGVSSGERVHAGRPRRLFLLVYDFPFRELAACRRRAGSPSLPSERTLKGCCGCLRTGRGLWHSLMHGRMRDATGSTDRAPISTAIATQRFRQIRLCGWGRVRDPGRRHAAVQTRGFARCTLAASCMALQ
jgi:hypothetical protein